MKVKTLSVLLIGGVLLTVVGYAAIILLFTESITEYSVDKSGVFGDSFGLLTSLFSGLAFAGLIITIVMQKDELALQREELQLTRKEFSGQKEELKIQNETLRVQKFESTFFQMIALHNEIIKSIDIQRGQKEFVGRDAFQEFYRKINRNTAMLTGFSSDNLAEIDSTYLNFYDTYAQNEIGHYFRNLYNIIKFVDKSEVPDKKTYTNMIRAQLSSYELALIFYNCLSSLGNEKFKPLIEKYSLLKTLPDNLLFNEVHKKIYEIGAYKST